MADRDPRGFRVMTRHLKGDDHERCPRFIPWDNVEMYQDSAKQNHDQSLERLAERGGLTPKELICVIENRKWNDSAVSESQAVKKLVSL